MIDALMCTMIWMSGFLIGIPVGFLFNRKDKHKERNSNQRRIVIHVGEI